jgi:hypothetical protein
MHPADTHSDPERELLVSHEGSIKIEKINGRPVVRFSIPPGMQGHTFAIDLSCSEEPSVPTGPFRFEYVLGSEFAIYESDLPSASFEMGYSHLKLAQELERATVSLHYVDTKAPTVKRQATLAFEVSDGVIKRLVLDVDEPDLSAGIRHINQIVADLLDSLSLLKGVPISIRHIDVSVPGQKFHRRYVTLPYGQHLLTEADFRGAQDMPARLRGAVRLYREGLSSSRPPYRLLCLYRVREVIEKVRAGIDREILTRGAKRTRPVRVLPANELTECYFPQFVGKRVGAFLNHVRNEYRLAVAHGNLDEYFKLVLDPADVRIDHRIDFTNAALASVVAEMIRDEAGIIQANGVQEISQ